MKKKNEFTLAEGATHVGTPDNKRIVAFTLAEVLITLGIIGVVAALTIPTLVNNYQTRSWNISSSNFEAKFGEALKIMNTQQSLSNLGTTERFVNELQKHMKVAKVCNNEELTLCFPDEINGSTSVIDVTDPTTYENNSSKPTQTKTIKTAKELGQKDWNTNTMGVQFANGVSAILAYNPKCSANPFDVNAVTVSGDKENITFGTDCVAMVYDTSSNAQPNEKGKDIRTSSMATVGDGDCFFKIGDACVTGKPSTASAISKAECEELKDDLSIQYCLLDDDYWAGAVKTCGGTQYMLTDEESILIGDYVYQDVEKAKKIGLYNKAAIWSNQEYPAGGGGNRETPAGTFSTMRRFLVVGYFGNTSDNGNWGDRLRTNSAPLVYCKSKT